MKYKSEIFKVIHQDAVEMYKIGGITESRMRDYDKMCLVNIKSEQKSTQTNRKKSINFEHANSVIA